MGKKVAPRVVIDTNVLVSCLLFRGHLSYLRDLWVQRKITPILSKATFDEFRQVLAYPKFALTPQEIRAIIDIEILPYFDVVETEVSSNGLCRGPHDEKSLTLAQQGSADYLTTGDQDLLVLHDVVSFRIVTPKVFHTIVT